MNHDAGHFRGSFLLSPRRETVSTVGLKIFFRGYLSNRAELAAQLGTSRAVDSSIVELISQCYQRWGRALTEHLDGQFALVMVNKQTGQVLLTHDALGVVPLYWSLEKGALRFATRVRDLVDQKTRSELNLKEVQRYLLFGSSTSEDTVYASINRLKPGTSIWIQNGSVVREVTWDPRRLAQIEYKRSGEYVEHFLALVDRSVRGSLEGRDSAWIALSGGLDSNTVLPAALKYCRELQAYSLIAPQWPESDESQWIERIVAKRGLAWHAINAEEVLPFSELPRDFSGSPNMAVMHLRLQARLNELFGSKVLLTGNGGDSFMGAQMGAVPSHLADTVFSGKLLAGFHSVMHWMRQSKPRRPLAYWLYHGVALPSLRHLMRRGVRPPHFPDHPPWLRIGSSLRANARAAHPKAAAPHCETPGQQAILDDLWQCAEVSAAADDSYSSRYPLFDRALFEFLWAIPWSQKHAPFSDRYLQRRALKGLVDDDIRTRIGYGTGTRSFVEGLSRSKQWQDYLCERPVMAELGLIDAEGWRQTIQQACVGQTNAEALLVRAISVEVWLKQLSTFRPAPVGDLAWAV